MTSSTAKRSLMYFLRNRDVSTDTGRNARKYRFDKMRVLYVKNNRYACVFDVWGPRREGRRKVVEIKKHTGTYYTHTCTFYKYEFNARPAAERHVAMALTNSTIVAHH